MSLFILVNALAIQWLLPDYTFYDVRRLTQLGLFLIIGLLILCNKNIRQKNIELWSQLPMLAKVLVAAFFALGLISASLAALPRFAFLEWASFMMLMIMAISMISLRTLLAQSFDRIMIYTFVAAIACYSLLAIGILITAYAHPYIGMDSYRIFYVLAAPTFNNPRFLTQFMAWTLPLIVLPNLLYANHHRFLRYVFYIISAYWWCLAIVGQSRALALACLIASVLLLILFGKSAKQYLWHQLWALLGGVALFLVLYQVLIHMPLRNIPLTDPNNRALIWNVALNLIQSHPLLGVGPMHFSYYAFSQEQFVAHPHNAILLLASQWGIPATLIVIALVAWGLYSWIKFSRHQQIAPTSLTIGLSGALIVAIIDSMFSGTLVMPVSQCMLALISGWALAIYFQNGKALAAKTFWQELILIGLLVLCTLMILKGILPDVANLPSTEANYVATCSITNCVNSPYYWLQGWIQFY
jgi:hypothetical protein